LYKTGRLRNRTLLLTLNVFSLTGGIEKVCKVLGKALFERSLEKQEACSIWSMHDQPADAHGNSYFPGEYYRAFAGKKISFVKAAVKEGKNCDTVILSHINLLPVGWMIKKISPRTRLILYAHGIEIWEPTGYKKRMLAVVDRFWAISSFTRDQLIQNQNIPAEKITVLNNCLDPLLPLPKNTTGKEEVKQRLGINKTDKVLFVLNRLRSEERYKGYDKVIDAIALLNRRDVVYIIAGKADESEAARLKQLIAKTGLQDQVKMVGYVPDEELPAYFALADIYIMPSTGEGFGIVFLEAMYYGLPVIAGNADGSGDALLDGKLGTLVDPRDPAAIAAAIVPLLNDTAISSPDQKMLMDHFSYDVYKRKLGNIMPGKIGLQDKTNRLTATTILR
jgi:glycosyltransferase involved in cell wall biosynthesis